VSEAKRRSKKDDEPPGPSATWRLLRRILPPIFWVAVVAGLVFGIIWLGRLGREKLADDPKFQVPVRDIDCDPPPGMTREAFLDEVQYLAQLPSKLPLLDETLPEQLQEAFAKHPWVWRVEAVKLEPPRQIMVTLRFRTPVLAVFWDNRWRAVDWDAILLPQNTSTKDLPRFRGNPKAPQGPSGTTWGDPEVAKQAREAKRAP